jgi:hypothetical protein
LIGVGWPLAGVDGSSQAKLPSTGSSDFPKFSGILSLLVVLILLSSVGRPPFLFSIFFEFFFRNMNMYATSPAIRRINKRPTITIATIAGRLIPLLECESFEALEEAAEGESVFVPSDFVSLISTC